MSRKISVLAAAVLAAVASAAGAVSLGELEVQSVPGEPFDATLDIKDVDLNISPLLVRVAPPATYLREGVQWPQEALDLRMARLKSASNVVRVRVTGKQTVSSAFPLLIEMNAGGAVTVREYQIDPVKGVFIVTSKSEAPAKTPAPAAESPQTQPAAQPKAAAESVEKVKERSEPPASEPAPKTAPKVQAKPEPTSAPKSEPKASAALRTAAAEPAAAPAAEPAAKKPHRRVGRSGPVVVREYVALNGFNPNESFPVQLDMTLWSIAKLYWPSYPGALLEQVAVALTEKNPRAFIDGDPSKIVAGGMLASPTSEEVFAVDPLEAFRRVHGAGVEVPGPTQNLIDAQRRSHTAAAEVAAVQLAEAAKGAKPEAVAEAGRSALAQWEAENDAAAVKAAEEKAAAEKTAEAAKAQEAADAAGAAEAGRAAAEKTEALQVEEKAPAETKTAPAAGAEEGAGAAKDAGAAQAGQSAAAKDASKDESKAPWRSGPLPWVLLVLALGAAVYAFTRRRREETAIEQPPRKTEGTVTLQREVPAATEAQLKAVDATISEAVKNGTTAGAMGAGALAYAEAQMAEDRKAAATAQPAPEAAARADDGKDVKEGKDAGDELFGDLDAAACAMKAAAAASAAAKAPEPAPAAPAAPAVPAEPAAGAQTPAAPEQPWLSPDDDELPPLAEGELAAARREPPADLPSALKDVDLELEDEAKTSVLPSAAPAYVPPLASEPVPPLASEPVTGAAAPVTPEAAAQQQPAAQPAPVEPPKAPESQAVHKQRAQTEALDAKLSLAGSFIGLGAKSEAQELLEEVAKNGSEAQRAQAAKLLERLKAGAQGAGVK